MKEIKLNINTSIILHMLDFSIVLIKACFL